MATDAIQKVARRASTSIISFATRTKKHIEIVLADGQQFVPSYTTLEKIQGLVNCRFDRDTHYDNLEIALVGEWENTMEKANSMTTINSKYTVTRRFLRSQQPLKPEHLPEDGIFRAGKGYTHPFFFIVPERLLDTSCHHRGAVAEEHLLLPPSMGEEGVAGAGGRLLDDQAPNTAKIKYAIRVTLKENSPVPGAKPVKVAEHSIKIRIVPARPAQPPLHVPEDSLDYVMRVEKPVQKSTLHFWEHTGCLVAEAAQPQALMLPWPHVQDPAVQTSTVLHLRFDPAEEDSQPPGLERLTVELKTFTFYGVHSFADIASRTSNKTSTGEVSAYHSYFSQKVGVSDRPVSTVGWTRHASSSDLAESARGRRQSSTTSSTSLVDENEAHVARRSNKSQSDLPYYTAQIRVPIILPQGGRRVFLPAFHTCFSSRTYSLRLHLSYRNADTKLGSPTISLKLPIQIGSNGNPDARPIISDEEMAAIRAREAVERELAHVSDFYRTRRGTMRASETELPFERLRLASVDEGITEPYPSVRSSIVDSEDELSGPQSSEREGLALTSSSPVATRSDPDNNPFHPANLQQHLRSRQNISDGPPSYASSQQATYPNDDSLYYDVDEADNHRHENRSPNLRGGGYEPSADMGAAMDQGWMYMPKSRIASMAVSN